MASPYLNVWSYFPLLELILLTHSISFAFHFIGTNFEFVGTSSTGSHILVAQCVIRLPDYSIILDIAFFIRQHAA